jgi:hypothetical protein
MSEQTLDLPELHSGGTSPAKTATYTVQVERRMWAENTQDAAEAMAWVDVATVSVPLRTKRRGIIAKALLDAGIRPEPGKPAPRVRVLDEESAAVVEPEPFQPEAEWRIV